MPLGGAGIIGGSPYTRGVRLCNVPALHPMSLSLWRRSPLQANLEKRCRFVLDLLVHTPAAILGDLRSGKRTEILKHTLVLNHIQRELMVNTPPNVGYILLSPRCLCWSVCEHRRVSYGLFFCSDIAPHPARRASRALPHHLLGRVYRREMDRVCVVQA